MTEAVIQLLLLANLLHLHPSSAASDSQQVGDVWLFQLGQEFRMKANDASICRALAMLVHGLPRSLKGRVAK